MMPRHINIVLLLKNFVTYLNKFTYLLRLALSILRWVGVWTYIINIKIIRVKVLLLLNQSLNQSLSSTTLVLMVRPAIESSSLIMIPFTTTNW